MSISIKVKLQGTTKTLQFSGEMSIHEACKNIKEKFEHVGGADHGLFYPEQGKWLIPSKIVDFYDLKSGDLVEYKKKHRQLKFRTLDGSIKTVIIDETLPVIQLVDVVCARIGITNTDEYSFQPEKTEVPDIKKKGKSLKVEQQIADDARWLNPDKTLAEQGISDTDLVLLKKKFFFTDQNIDRNDPVQLNLLYNQAKESILLGKNPCTIEEAAQFAAIQCQIQFQNHEPEKHKPGLLKLKEYVPPEYLKKDMEKKIFHEHKKLQGLNDLNSKFRYVQLSRSLKSYGITFFLVKERVKKNKLVPALIGVTKSSVVKLDMDTKEVLVEWKLTQLRRWAASPNSFTLDFGDYAEAYYSVQTTEGEQISQLIAGYIDIILKRRKEVEKVVVEDEVEETTVEEYIKPTKATNFVGVVNTGHRVALETNMRPTGNAPGGMKAGFNGEFPSQMSPQFLAAEEPEYLRHQQAFYMSVKASLAMLRNTAADLNNSANLPPIGNDPAAQAWREQTIDVNTSNIASQVAAHLAAAASIMNNVTGIPEEMDYELMQADISSLTANLSQMGPALKLVAGLSDDGDEFLDIAMAIVKATVDLINSAQYVAQGVTAVITELHSDGRNLAAEAFKLLSRMQRAEISIDEQNDLNNLAASVGKSVMELVANAKLVSKTVEDAEAVQMIISDAKFAFETSHNLIACVITAAPTANFQQCTDQIFEGSVLMREVIGMLANSCGVSTNMEAVDNFLGAAQRVEEAIARLVDRAAKAGSAPGSEESELDQHYDVVISACERMTANSGEMEAIILNTKALTLASMQFVAGLKKTAGEVENEDERLRLIAAAKGLAVATSKMVAFAKDAARSITDAEKQLALKNAVEELKKSSNAAAGPQLRDRVLYRLSKAVKDVIATSKQLTAMSKSCAPSNRNQGLQVQMNQASRKVNETLPAMISALKSFQNAPIDMIAQTKLVHSAKFALAPGYALLGIANTAAPSVSDSVVQAALAKVSKLDEDNLRLLEKLLNLVDDLNSEYQIENALLSIKCIQKDLVISETAGFTVNYATPELAQLDLYSVAASIQGTIALLAETAAKGDDKQTGVVATDAVLALQALFMAVQGFAATEEDSDFRSQLLSATSGVGDTLCELISAAKSMTDGGVYNDELSGLAMNASNALTVVVGCMPGQRELESAIVNISDIVENLATSIPAAKSVVPNEQALKCIQLELQNNTTKMSMAANALVSASNGTSNDLRLGAESIVDAFKEMVASSLSYGAYADAEISGKITRIFQEVGTSSTILLQASKGLSADKDNFSFRDQLLDSAKSISAAMSGLLDICSATVAGHKECNEACQITALASSTLDALTSSEKNNETYGECLSKLTDRSKIVMSNVGTLNTLARSGDMSRLAAKVVEVANSLVSLTNVSKRSAYLVGMADLSFIPASGQLIDKESLKSLEREVIEACEILIDPSKNQKEVLQSAATIARSTASICTVCKTLGQSNKIIASSRNEFVVFAKELAECTSNLVGSIKKLALSLDEESRSNCKETYTPLLEVIHSVIEFSDSSEFSGTPAKMGLGGIAAQKPILDKQRALLLSSENVFNVVKMICANPEDENLFIQLGAGVKNITEALQTVAKLISTSVPGQKDCEEVIAKITENSTAIDQAIVESVVNSLEPIADTVEKASLADSIRALSSLVEVITKNISVDPGQMGQSILQIPESLQNITTNIIIVSSNLVDLNNQKSLLEALKESSDNLLEYLFAIKAILIGAKNVDHQKKIDSTKKKLRENLSKLSNTMEGVVTDGGGGELAKFVDKIEALQLSQIERPEEGLLSYHSYSEKIEEFGKQLVDVVGEVLSKTKTAQQHRVQGEKLSNLCEAANITVQLTCFTADNEEIKTSVAAAFRELCIRACKLVQAMQLASGKSSADQVSRAKLSQTARDISISISNLIAAAKEGSRGLIRCQESIANVNDVISDLESSLIFAQAGQLDPSDIKNTFSKNKDSMLASVKDFGGFVKSYIAAVSGTQEEMADLAAASVLSLKRLGEEVKKGAMSITSADKNMQQHLLSSTIDVSTGLQSVISNAINSSGKHKSDPALIGFSNAVRSEFNAISEFVRITKVLSDESTRGTRALDVAINDIGAAVDDLKSDSPAQGFCLPDEVTTLAKMLATGAANIVTITARNTSDQDELVAAGNLIKKQIQDLCRAGKAATNNAPSEEREEMHEAVTKSCRATQSLLQSIKSSRDQGADLPVLKIEIQLAAKAVALAVSEIVGASSNLVPTGYEDMSDPNVIAERDLLAATSMIESAAKKLTLFQPVEKVGKTIEELNFEDQILDAAKSIAAASSALVRSATIVQREIISKRGPLSKSEDMYFNDGTWSDGLVSAAKQVAQATKELCESADQAAKGLNRDRVIVAAKNVSASTAQLLSAAMVRSDAQSQTQVRLKVAGKAVTNATAQLVKASEESMAFLDTDELILMKDKSATTVKIMEMEAQMSILKMEKELDRARNKLASVRKGKYAKEEGKKSLISRIQSGSKSSGERSRSESTSSTPSKLK